MYHIQCIVSIGLRGVHLVNKQAFICLIISHKSSEYSWIEWNGHCAQMCADKFLKLHALMFGWPKSALIPRKWCGFRCNSWSPLSFCGFNIWGVSIHAYFWLIPLIHLLSTSTPIYIPLTKQIWKIILVLEFLSPSQHCRNAGLMSKALHNFGAGLPAVSPGLRILAAASWL